jgi:hypothetical protein
METTALVFGGIVVSALVEYIKRKAKLSTSGVLALVAGLSLIGGGIYVALVHFGYWESVVTVLMAAGAFYAFIIKNVADTKPVVE